MQQSVSKWVGAVVCRDIDRICAISVGTQRGLMDLNSCLPLDKCGCYRRPDRVSLRVFRSQRYGGVVICTRENSKLRISAPRWPDLEGSPKMSESDRPVDMIPLHIAMWGQAVLIMMLGEYPMSSD